LKEQFLKVKMYTQNQTDFLHKMAAKYIWWETPDIAVQRPQRILAQVMDIGTYADCCALIICFSRDVLGEVLKNAECGWYRAKSWHFWHNALSDDFCEVPPLPSRFSN
jgi:hypothetical protein